MVDHEFDHENFLIEKTYILAKYIYPEDFYDYLTSKHVLSSDDKELIDCYHINPTRRQRACKLLEVLQKKGYEGFRHFMDYLEWEYSQVYEEITKKKARDPPPDYHPQPLEQRTRIKDLLLMDALTVMMADLLHKSFQQSHDLWTLDEITRVVKINQEDKKDLEKGMEDLRNKLERLERQHAEKCEELSNRMKDIDQLKNDKMVLYEDKIQLMSECQKYREILTKVQVEKDNLAKQLQDTKDKLADTEGRTASCSKTVSSACQVPPKIKYIKSKVGGRPIQAVKPQGISEQSSRMKSHAKHKTVERDARTLTENLTEEHNTNSDLKEREMEIRQVNTEILSNDHRLENLYKSLNDARTRIKRYYQNIFTLGEENMKVGGRPIQEVMPQGISKHSSRMKSHAKHKTVEPDARTRTENLTEEHNTKSDLKESEIEVRQLEVPRLIECQKYRNGLETYTEEISKTTEIFKLNHQLKAELDELQEKYSRMKHASRSLCFEAWETIEHARMVSYQRDPDEWSQNDQSNAE